MPEPRTSAPTGAAPPCEQAGSRLADFLPLAETLSSLTAVIQDEKLVYVNPAGCALLGRTREWLTGRAFWEVVHPDDREQAIARGRRRHGGIPEPKRLVERLVHADGRTIWMDYAIDLIQIDGRAATLVTGHDVTARRAMEEELRRSEDRFRVAFTHAAIGKAIVSLEHRIEQANPAACRILGYPEAELVRLDTRSITHPDDRTRIEALRDSLLQGPEISTAIDVRLLRKDARIVQAHLTVTLLRSPDGSPYCFLVEFEDVTERASALRALEESERRFRSLCTQAPVLLMAFDPDGRVREVSQYWLQTTGYTRHEVVGRDGWDFITPESRERLRAAIEENQRRNEAVLKNLPLRMVCKDGTTIDLLSTSVAELDEAGVAKGAICVQINLSDLQRAEAALRESEERYRALVEHAPEAIMVLDVDLDRFVDVNAHAEALFGYTREQLLQMGPLDFCSDEQANGRPSCEVIADEHRRVLDGETPVFEFNHVDAAGREIVCQTRLSRLPAADRRLIRATITDVSELKQLQEKVRHAERLAAVGVLAAGVAHEIGNPLMALSMAAQSLERRTCDAYAQTKLTLIREHIERISRIVRQLADLARPQNARITDCDLNRVLRRAVEMMRYDARAQGAEIRYELAEHLPDVEAIEDELTQVCINLALNAFDAMAQNGAGVPRRLTIRSFTAERAVGVEFEDTGPGVPAELRERVFQPFFTTKEDKRGSGLGLSICHRILTQHRGTLQLVETQAGARFRFELPRKAAH